MNLKGKKVYFLGDSITEGVGVSNLKNRYTDVFANNTGTIVSNFGVSGTRIAPQRNSGGFDTLDNNFIMRLDDMPSSADIVVVFGGTNDFGHGNAPLGSFNDHTEYTFYGALHTLYTKLINKYPNALLVIMTPLHRLSENANINEIGLPVKPLISYVNAIKEVAAYYSLPVLDLWSTSGIQPAIKVLQEKYMPDGLHPNDNGARRIAERLEAFLMLL